MIPFSMVDLAVLVLYLVGTAAIGASFYKRRPTAKDYFLGGGRMGWLPVGISIIAADLSAISVMGTPAWSYQHGIGMLWVTVGYPIVAPLVVFVFAPFYSRLQLYTAYEYLERRFNRGTRLLASILFQLLRAWHVAVALYGPALVLHLVTGSSLWKCILTMGAFTTLYTGLGGMKAVIWTDVLQFVTVIGGILTILALSLHRVPGGLVHAWQMARDTGRLDAFNTDPSLTATTSLWACLIGGAVLSLGPMATDQVILQRLFTTRSPKDFARSVWLQSIFIVPVIGLLYCLGLALYAFYVSHPERLVGIPNLNALVPWFVLTQLPHGVSGLVIASIFAASMAVMSAGINALTTAFTIDLYAPLIAPGRSSADYAAVGRRGTYVWGVMISVLALFAGKGDLAIAYTRVTSSLIGPMLAIFLLGILTRRSNATGAITGAAVSTIFGSYLLVRTNVSFLYVGAISTVLACAVGYLTSLCFAAPDQDKTDGLTLATIGKQEMETR